MRVLAKLVLAFGLLGTPALADEAIPYVPFTLGDFIDPATAQPMLPGAVVTIDVGGRRFFHGLSQDFLRHVNELERQYCALGHSLRQDGQLLTPMSLDPESLKEQFLADLKLRSSVLKDKLRDARSVCEKLTLAHLPNAATSILVDDGLRLAAKEFVARVNKQQDVFCAVGYSLFEELGGVDALRGRADAVSKILEARVDLFDALGLSRRLAHFDWGALAPVPAFADMVRENDSLAKLVQKYGDALPDDLQLPDLPDIPAPNPARRMELAVKKRKDWVGLNEGSRDLLNVYATASYEIRGSERQEEASAEGKAGVFILGNELNALYGFGQFYAGPDEVRGKLMLRALGQDVFPPVDVSHSVKWVKSEPRLFAWSFDRGYQQQFFIGPIPVTVEVGARADVWLGYEVALLTTELTAAVMPGANAEAHADAGVGFSGVVSVGAGGGVTLLQLDPRLAGLAGIRFDAEGLPFLRLSLDSDVRYAALNGRIYAYAEYPVPRFGIPPWKIQKSELDLFSWPGFGGTYKIMSWGMDVTPFGVTMTGDLLDQTDRTEMSGVQAAIDLEQRRQALHRLEIEVMEKERATFEAVLADLGGASQRGVAAKVDGLAAKKMQAVVERKKYLDELVVFAQ